MRRLNDISEDDFDRVLLPRLHQAKDCAERATINTVWRRLVKGKPRPNRLVGWRLLNVCF
jgi:hypothetical protein